MIKEVISTGRTVDAAIDSGCAELGLDRGEVDFEIISMPRKGLFGLSQTPAKVRVFVERPDPVPVPEKPAPRPMAKPEEKPAPKTEVAAPAAVTPKAPPVAERVEPKPDLVEKAEESSEAAAPAAPCDFGNKVGLAHEYVTAVLGAMNLPEVTTSVSTHDNVILVKLNGDVSGVAIGRHGETLDALQYLAGLAANRGEGDYVRVVLDSGNYRDKRRNTLEQLARRLAGNVLRTGRSTTLEPMNPYERRIIHSTITDMEGVTSASIGEEPNRCVVISATNPPAHPLHDSRPPRSGPRPPRRDGDRPSFPPRDGSRDARPAEGGRGPRRDGRDDRRGPRREKPAPYQESGRREVAPSEAENQPLYGKIEI